MKKFGKYILILLTIVAVFVSICFIPIRVSKLIPFVEEQIENLAHVYTSVKTAFLDAGGREEDFVKMTETNIKNALDI